MKYLECFLWFAIGAVSFQVGAWLWWMFTRGASSGRFGHIAKNPRLGPELSDEDHEAYGAMIYSMRNHEERK